MESNLFSEIYKTDNIFGLLAILVVAFIFLVWSKFDSIIKFIKPRNQETKKIEALINHSIFYKFDDIYREVRSMRFTTHDEFDEIKTKLLHRLIREQIYTIKKTLEEVIIGGSIDDFDENKMEAKVMSLNNSILKSYNSRTKQVFINDYGILEEDADLMIDAYADFRKKFHRNFENQLAVIARNNDYTSNYLKVSALLEVVSTSLYSIPAYALMAMNDVNGAFLKYKK